MLFCAIELAFAGDGKGYFYPKPSISFEEEICPPGTNGVFPHCEYLPPTQPLRKCGPGESRKIEEFKVRSASVICALSGYSGHYPGCKEVVEEKQKLCVPPTVGTFPNCFNPPCPSGFSGTFPDCKKSIQKCAPPAVGTFPNCINPPCPPGFDGTFPNCQKPVQERQQYLPPVPTGLCEMGNY